MEPRPQQTFLEIVLIAPRGKALSTFLVFFFFLFPVGWQLKLVVNIRKIFAFVDPRVDKPYGAAGILLMRNMINKKRCF